jgi:CarD family transcriptional regulator
VRGPPSRQEAREELPAVEGVITSAAELSPGDRVVYPNQGVCRITGVEQKEIAGQKLELVRMEREEDGAAVLVPKGKVASIGLRRVATGSQMEGVFHYLAAQYDDPELDWKIRHRDNADRLIAGGVLGVAEVVKGLHALSRIRPLPTKEREQYDGARHLLVHEVSVSLGVPLALAEDYIDYALMPPLGVKFQLKPPPKPVALPSRARRRVVRTDDEDLGLDELGIELPEGEVPGVEGEAPPGEIAVGGAADAAEEGDESSEGAEGGPASPPAEAEPSAKPGRKAAAPAARGKVEPAARPQAAAKAAARPPAKAAPKKAPAPARKPAARAEKPAEKKAPPKPAARKPSKGKKK